MRAEKLTHDDDRVLTWSLHRGDPAALTTQLGRIRDQLGDTSFADAFKGEFQQTTMPEDDIERICSFLNDQLERLE